MAPWRPRFAVVGCSIIGAATLFAPTTALGTRARASVSLVSTMVSQLNAIRSAHGLARLTISPGLTAAAIRHSDEMVARGYFAHKNDNGTPFWQLIERYYPEGSARFWSVGQNLLWASGQVDAAVALQTWMHSPPHRANILDPRWSQIGVAVVEAPGAHGVFGGRNVTVITTDFGVRS
jgi:uncharacterized protein YkwD